MKCMEKYISVVLNVQLLPLKGYLKLKYCGCICISFLFGPFFFSSVEGRFEGEGIFGGGLAFCLLGVIYVQAQVQFASMSSGCSGNLTASVILFGYA